MLVNGTWKAAWEPVQASDERGRFVRQASRFRNWITPDGAPGPSGEGGFAAEPHRYHLYVALICPWASRTLIVRVLKGLEDMIGVTVTEPFLTDQGWRFGDYPGADRDLLNEALYLHQIYTTADPRYTGRATVPVLWDRERRTIVSNESADIVRMLNSAFDGLGARALDLYPADLRAEIDALNAPVYETLNNGVYRAGFATGQTAYEEAARAVFRTLENLEQRLADGRRFLFGERLTESDVRVFVTLIRFDAAYHGLFKCNLKRLADYPGLSAYARRFLALPGVQQTVNLDHIKAGYYSMKALNPSGIVPIGPAHVLADEERA
jgi:glutathionyl-hydroquinone reductase